MDESQVWETGNPRNDRLVNSTPEDQVSLKKELAQAIGLDVERVVLYAPTWREWVTEPSFLPLPDRDFSALRSFLESRNAILVLRSHHREALAAVKNGWHGGRIQVSDMLDLSWDVNEWQIVSDVLVTDYSSIFFDFLVLDRPVVHVPFDIDEYSSRRGFMVDPYEDFAGPAVLTQADLISAIDQGFEDGAAQKTRRAELNRIHNPLEDGGSTTRVGSRIIELLEQGRRRSSSLRNRSL